MIGRKLVKITLETHCSEVFYLRSQTQLGYDNKYFSLLFFPSTPLTSSFFRLMTT